MTTLRQIVTDAFRESGLIPAGVSPEAEQFDEALRRLQTAIRSLYGNLAGENLTNASFGTAGLVNQAAINNDTSQTVEAVSLFANTRLVCNLGAVVTLYMPPNPRDGARFGIVDNIGNFSTFPVTLSGNGRKIEDGASVVLDTDLITREWFYRADLGSWERITDLTADSAVPFPLEFDDLLVTYLAMRINPRFGQDTKSETVALYNRMRSIIRARYSQKEDVSPDVSIISKWRHSEFSTGTLF